MRLQETLRGESILIVPLIAALAGLLSPVYGQFTSGVNLVEVYATVSDRNGEPVTGLTAADFHVFEDGAPQAVAAFAGGEFPLAVGIGLDRSFSMGGKSGRLTIAKRAARSFIAALRPDDEVMVMAIGSETAIVGPLSRDHQRALAAVDGLDVWGTTPLYDATVAAIDAIQPAKGRRALVLLSDGVDRDSTVTPADLVEQARRREVLVYPIAIGAARPPVFAELASVTGGRSFFVKDTVMLAATLETIARELRFQYLLGYIPPHHAEATSWHAIDVTVDRPDAKVRARDGYFSR